MQVKDIADLFNRKAPFFYQESYDNSGLQTGSPDMEIFGALLCIDVTEKVLEEAERLKVNLIISHHPLIFQPIKSITGRTSTERILERAIRKSIAILSVHTNLDCYAYGVSYKMCTKLGLKNCKVLDPLPGKLVKLVFFVPYEHAEKVREQIFLSGAGVIGEYDMCSFNVQGNGTFRGSSKSNPFIGEKEKMHVEPEVRVETIIPSHLSAKVVHALIESHPYEEVAYDLYPLNNTHPNAGMGMTGELEKELHPQDFLQLLKQTFQGEGIRYTNHPDRKIKHVAVCGGSGGFLLGKAISSGADAYVTGDIKYHQFFEAEGKLLLADIGHYESEQFTKEIFYELLIENYPKFALYLSEVKTNPINYL